MIRSGMARFSIRPVRIVWSAGLIRSSVTRKRPRRKGGEPERAPVEPPNPKLLSGGAAAELEFDD